MLQGSAEAPVHPGTDDATLQIGTSHLQPPCVGPGGVVVDCAKHVAYLFSVGVASG